MISNITRGTSFKGLLDYAFNEGEKRVEGKVAILIGGNMSGETVADLAREFGLVRRLRPDIEKPVWHESLRSVEGENISPAQWHDIAVSHMKQLGYSKNHPYVIIQHVGENHIHIVSSRIAINGELYYGRNEHLVASRDCRRIEIEFGLQQVDGPEYGVGADGVHRITSPAADRTRLRSNEIKMKTRTGKSTPRESLQKMLTSCMTNCKTLVQYEIKLQQANIKYRKSSNGYSYEYAGIAFKGSQLGKRFSFAAITRSIELNALFAEKQRLYQEVQNARRRNWNYSNYLKRRQKQLLWKGGSIRYVQVVGIILARFVNMLIERRRAQMFAQEQAAVAARITEIKSARQSAKTYGNGRGM